jgi:two-component system, NarL family, response regulator NreC
VAASEGGGSAATAARLSRPSCLSDAGTIRVYFVDGGVLVREGLRALAEQQPDLVVVGGSSSAVIGTAYEYSPDVVVADVDLPDAQGVDAIALLRKEFPEAALLVLTLVDHPPRVQQVLEAGVDGYMLKTATTSEFFFGIRAAARGQTYLQPSLGVELARWHGAPSATTVYVDQLTPKELEVLRLLALGHTNSEIAEMRGVSLRTVEAQRARILQRLGRRTRAELVQYAHDLGILDFGPG